MRSWIARAGPRDAVQLLEHADRLRDVLDDVLHQDLVERPVLDRVREDVEVVDDVSVRVGRDVESDRSGNFALPQPMSSTAPGPVGRRSN